MLWPQYWCLGLSLTFVLSTAVAVWLYAPLQLQRCLLEPAQSRPPPACPEPGLPNPNESAPIAAPPSLPGCVLSPLFVDQQVRARNKFLSGGVRKYISFALYGAEDKYTVGAIRNAELALKIYPGWSIRFYVDSSVPFSVVLRLRELGAEVYLVEHSSDWCAGMYWRFMIWDDPGVDLFQVRDTDSRLSQRDYEAVQEWEREKKGFHVMRDHPSHSGSLVGGGLWGARHDFSVVTSITEAIYEFAKTRTFKYRHDMDFLDQIWELVSRNVTLHDTFSCERSGGKGFPSPRLTDRFVGERMDARDTPHGLDLYLLKQATIPRACIR